MKHEIFYNLDFVSFTFTPGKGEILSGIRSIYTDSIGRFHITVGYENNVKKQKKIKRQNDKQRARMMKALVIK